MTGVIALAILTWAGWHFGDNLNNEEFHFITFHIFFFFFLNALWKELLVFLRGIHNKTPKIRNILHLVSTLLFICKYSFLSNLYDRDLGPSAKPPVNYEIVVLFCLRVDFNSVMAYKYWTKNLKLQVCWTLLNPFNFLLNKCIWIKYMKQYSCL